MKLNIQLFAVPFRKVSKTSGRMRRTHYKISENATTKWTKNKKTERTQKERKACGTYKGKEVITKKEA